MLPCYTIYVRSLKESKAIHVISHPPSPTKKGKKNTEIAQTLENYIFWIVYLVSFIISQYHYIKKIQSWFQNSTLFSWSLRSDFLLSIEVSNKRQTSFDQIDSKNWRPFWSLIEYCWWPVKRESLNWDLTCSQLVWPVTFAEALNSQVCCTIGNEDDHLILMHYNLTWTRMKWYLPLSPPLSTNAVPNSYRPSSCFQSMTFRQMFVKLPL